jgi:hypothetical protein
MERCNVVNLIALVMSALSLVVALAEYWRMRHLRRELRRRG